MCLILFAYRVHPDYPLIVAANRDEFFERPSQAAHFWEDENDLLAGRDLQAQGTWMGINRQGRFAAVTNFRQGGVALDKPGSRGDLTRNFLISDAPTGPLASDTYLNQVADNADHYNGFNLLTGTINSSGYRLGYLSHQGHKILDLPPGIYGLSNALLDTPWPKVQQGKSALASLLASRLSVDTLAERLLEPLADRQTASDDLLPSTGVGIEFERLLSSRFISSPSYGTRTSTALIINRDSQVSFLERSFNAEREVINEADFNFQLKPAP